MSIDKVRLYFKQFNLQDKIQEFDVSSATVDLAAKALNCEPARIAKSLTFNTKDGVAVIVTAGDAKVDNSKFKKFFNLKAKMLTVDEVEELVGHKVGGVCPFAVNDNIQVYLDKSLQRFKTVYPACGSSNSAIELTLPQLEVTSKYISWIDVCKDI